MVNFPHPGVLTEVQRQNLEVIAYKNPLQYLKIEFDFKTVGRVGILPKNSILDFSHLVFIEDKFDLTFLFVGTSEHPYNILRVGGINNINIPTIQIGNLNGRRTEKDYPIHIGFNGTPTKGRGWLILKYILWSRV